MPAACDAASVVVELLPQRQRSPVAVSVAVRYAVIGVVALALASLHLSRRPATLCPLRMLTGIPCPFCGGTTAAVHLGHGDVPGAVAASPLAVVLITGWPLVGAVRPPRWWSNPKIRYVAIAATLTAAEVWQLLRLHVFTF